MALALLVFTSLTHAGNPPPLEKLSFLPQWRPQAQFAGYYVALEKGLYRRAGIDLEIIPGGPDRSATDYLIHHRADIVSMWLSSAVQLAADGVDIGHLAQVIQRSALMMVSKKSSGINSIRDMNGRKIAMWPSDFQIQPLAFFERNGIAVQPITLANTLNIFLRGGSELALVMWYNEYHTLQMYGVDPEQLQPFFFSETDLDFPEDGLFAMGDTWVSRQNTLCRFVQASFDGWRYAFDHPEEAIDIVLAAMRRESVPASRSHQAWMLSCMKSLILPRNPSERMGVLQVSDYVRVSRVLEDCHRITGTPNFDYFSKGCMNDVSQ
ncbi:ABC transporter substrate-binding protein [Desulfatirhabdium butyrativorans]|uniref:ABC transporter substrate-binding protein n=1 Tax=Desulfatirhabdium butyrativorans TaxID=340467 RepID=UPI0006854D51|nr:ABC transporter substrate-binding protein [Desulfatirhabdium butyrativorans]